MRLGLECANGEAVVRRQEDHRWHSLRRASADHFEAVDLRHLDVEEQHVGLERRRAPTGPRVHRGTRRRRRSREMASSSCRTPRRAAGSSSATSTVHLVLVSPFSDSSHHLAIRHSQARDRAPHRAAGSRSSDARRRRACGDARACCRGRVPALRRAAGDARCRRLSPSPRACPRRGAPRWRPGRRRCVGRCRDAARSRRGAAARSSVRRRAMSRDRCRTPAGDDPKSAPVRPPGTGAPGPARPRATTSLALVRLSVLPQHVAELLDRRGSPPCGCRHGRAPQSC